MNDWIEVCGTEEIDCDDLITWEHQGRTLAIYNTEEGFFATDGLCTHEHQLLEDGIVVDMVIECPLHNGRFDIRSGRALSPPVCVDLATYPVKVQNGRVFVQI